MQDTELNEAVARKLGYHADLPVSSPVGDPDGCLWIKGSDTSKHVRLPDYCHSIAAAWEVVEAIIQDKEKQMEESGRSTTPHFELRMGPTGVFHCDLGNSGEAGWYQPNAPMAICLAFLKLE